jgi:hypothetical protein
METSHIDPGHARPTCGFYPQVTVFPDNAASRIHTQPASSFQKWIGLRLVAAGILTRDDRVETVFETDMLENLTADVAMASGHHGCRDLAGGPSGNIDHRIDGLNLMELLKESFFLQNHGLLNVELPVNLTCQQRKNVTRRPAAEGVEAILVKPQAMQLCDMCPGDEVGRHGIGEGAVTVEEQGSVGLLLPDVTGVRHGKTWCQGKRARAECRDCSERASGSGGDLPGWNRSQVPQ